MVSKFEYRIVRKSCCVVAFAMVFPALVLGKEWRGIVPLKSTRSDVEKRFGQSKTGVGTYQFENERVTIIYSDGSLKGDDCIGKAPKGVVTRISVMPEEELLLQDLKLDLGRFEKTRNPQYPHLVTYHNEDEGVAYEVSEQDNDDIVQITYYPSKKDCDQSRNKERE